MRKKKKKMCLKNILLDCTPTTNETLQRKHTTMIYNTPIFFFVKYNYYKYKNHT